MEITVMPRELANRMAQIHQIASPTRSDYEEILELISQVVPMTISPLVWSIGLERIPIALKDRSGARFVEQLMTLAARLQREYEIANGSRRVEQIISR